MYNRPHRSPTATGPARKRKKTAAERKKTAAERKAERIAKEEENSREHHRRMLEFLREQRRGRDGGSTGALDYNTLLSDWTGLFYQVYRMGQLREIDDIGANILGLNPGGAPDVEPATLLLCMPGSKDM